MTVQDGIMYLHFFKNPQRVQNMRDELFSNVRTFLEVRRRAGVAFIHVRLLTVPASVRGRT